MASHKRHKLNSKVSNRRRGMFKHVKHGGKNRGGKRQWHS